MLSDLTIARAAFSRSTTSVDAQLNLARLRLQVEAVRTQAEDRAGPDASVEVVVDSSDDGTPPGHVDKTA